MRSTSNDTPGVRQRLKVVFSIGPVPSIADALGYQPATIERHAIGSASTYAEYVAAARDQRRTS